MFIDGINCRLGSFNRSRSLDVSFEKQFRWSFNNIVNKKLLKRNCWQMFNTTMWDTRRRSRELTFNKNVPLSIEDVSINATSKFMNFSLFSFLAGFSQLKTSFGGGNGMPGKKNIDFISMPFNGVPCNFKFLVSFLGKCAMKCATTWSRRFNLIEFLSLEFSKFLIEFHLSDKLVLHYPRW